MTMTFFIIIKVLSTIAIEQPPCQIWTEFAPLWHEKELTPRKRHWMVWFSNVKRKMIVLGWPTIMIHLQGNVSSFSFLFDLFSSFSFPLHFPIIFFYFSLSCHSIKFLFSFIPGLLLSHCIVFGFFHLFVH